MKLLNKLLLAVMVLAFLLNPLTAMYLQAFLINVWDIASIQAGIYITMLAGAFVFFYIGVLFAKHSMKEEKTQEKNIAKAKKSKRSLDGLKYEF